MNLPFHDPNLRHKVVYSHESEIGIFTVEATPLTPCYAADGAGKIMSIKLELFLTDKQGNRYLLQHQDQEA